MIHTPVITRHAALRMNARGIPAEAVAFILRHGTSKPSGPSWLGASRAYAIDATCRLPEAASYRGIVVIANDVGSVVTVFRDPRRRA